MQKHKHATTRTCKNANIHTRTSARGRTLTHLRTHGYGDGDGDESMIIEGKTRSLDTGVQAGTGSNESETLGTPAPASGLAVRATNFAATHDHFIEIQLQ